MLPTTGDAVSPADAKDAVLITGASSGIGLELSRLFARNGYDEILVARRRESLEPLVNELATAHGVRIVPVAQDLARPAAAAAVYDEATASGLSVGCLVNNAGVGLYGAFTETSLAAELDMIQLNVMSLVHLTKLCLPDMVRRRRGRVLNVASTAAFLPGPGMAVYYATKAFVLSFSEGIAEEVRDSGVTVTALCPGPTRSGFQDKAKMQASRLMQGSFMDASDVAAAGYRGMLQGRRVIIPGVQNKMVPHLVRVLPRRVVVAVSRLAAERA
jgi:short-subunit dehydrogenase